ncbi:MAG: alanine racemase [Terrimesophilobacter sp.]
MTATARIDVTGFRHNVATLVSIVAPARVMLAVKADAYGHGMLELAPAALQAGASSLAVLEIPTALRLREAGITAPLFAWLHGSHSDFGAAAEHDIDLGISARWQLDAIAAAQPSRPISVHLKVDTGLHRNGATEEEWPGLVAAALDAQRAGTVTVRAIWSHLADTSPDDDAEALSRLQSAIGAASALGLHVPLSHIAASSAGIRMPEARLDLVRFGIAAYGISPFDDTDGRGLGLIPVMSLSANVTSVDPSKGTATVGIGFADGVMSAALPHAEVLIAGIRRRIVSIGPDSLVVEALEVQPNDEVQVFGPGDSGEPTAEEWARWADSIGDEIVTHVAPHVPRVYIERDGA